MIDDARRRAEEIVHALWVNVSMSADNADVLKDRIADAIAAARREEREACAQLADLMCLTTPANIGTSIRYRAGGPTEG